MLSPLPTLQVAPTKPEEIAAMWELTEEEKREQEERRKKLLEVRLL